MVAQLTLPRLFRMGGSDHSSEETNLGKTNEKVIFVFEKEILAETK
jgi:hypothetical protein